MESSVTPNITRSSDSFRTVPPIVNGGDWGCIVRDMEIIIVLGLTRVQFHPPKVTPRTNLNEVYDRSPKTMILSISISFSNSHTIH